VSSKWETVDPEKLEKQAITTSKWDFFDAENAAEKKGSEPVTDFKGLTAYDSDTKSDVSSDFDDDIDGKPLEEEHHNEKKSDNLSLNSSINAAAPVPASAAVVSVKDPVIDEKRRKMLRDIEVNYKT
jgi:hypothetical protein